jgi:hypothetical protein
MTIEWPLAYYEIWSFSTNYKPVMFYSTGPWSIFSYEENKLLWEDIHISFSSQLKFYALGQGILKGEVSL